jgi:hypothetical protein
VRYDVVIFKAFLDGKKEDIMISNEHPIARIVEGLDCGFHAGLAFGFGLERGMSVMIGISSIPEWTSERPEKVDQFSSPDVACIEMPVDLEGKEELVLDLGPLLGEAAAKELSPAKDCLFLSKAGQVLMVMVDGEARRMIEDFIFQALEQGGLENWSCVFEFTYKRKTARTLVEVCFCLFNFMGAARRANGGLSRVDFVLLMPGREPLKIKLGNEALFGEWQFADGCEMSVPID